MSAFTNGSAACGVKDSSWRYFIPLDFPPFLWFQDTTRFCQTLNRMPEDGRRGWIRHGNVIQLTNIIYIDSERVGYDIALQGS